MLTPEILTDFSGGINLRGQPLSIGKNDLLACSNMHPVADGYLIGRGGQATYTTAELVAALPVKSLYRFYKQNGQTFQLATCGQFVFTVNDGTGVGTAIDNGYVVGSRFSFTTWSAKDKVYWTNGTQVLKSFDGTTVATVGGTPPVGSMVEFHQDRLWMLLPNSIRFTDLNVDNVWQAAALINIADNKGGTAQFLKSANRVLIAGKTSGLWRFEGSPLLGGLITKYSDVGCIAGFTADAVTVMQNGQVVPVGVAFLGTDGVYVTDGYTTRLISQKIDDVFTGYFRGAIGKYYPKKRQYFLSFNNAGGANNALLVATNIDVSGSRVGWTTYSGFQADSFCVWDGGTDNGELVYSRSTDGHIRKMDLGAQDMGVDYVCAFTTRYLGDPGVNKQVRWLKPVFDAQRVVHYQIDYFQKQFSSGPVSLDTPTALIWDVGLWDVGTWAGPSLNSARTSNLDGRYGRYLSLSYQNTGDGPSFKFFQLEIEMRLKDHRLHDMITLNQAI